MELPPNPSALRPRDTSVKPVAPVDKTQAEARAAAEAFETAFIAEMLKSSGLNEMPASFGGGAGEEAFSSFLTQEYAQLMSERGGIGLAEQVFEALKQRTTGS